jgi:hypothetical protein
MQTQLERTARGDRDILITDKLGDESRVIPFVYSITSYGADFPVDGLVRRISDGDIYIPSFQRSYVWNIREASRFIESLLLGLPVPAIFLSRESDTNKLLVIDGQQRLRTLQYFYDGLFEPTGSRFALTNVQPQFRGTTYKSLLPEDRRRLDDSVMHAIIVKQDEPSDDDSSVYQIFERLNTGGRQLQPQEIRACIYHGEFSALLRRLNDTPSWRALYGRISPRMRDQELILRFLALYFYRAKYTRPMKEFLNDYMGANRHLSVQTDDELTAAFIPAVETTHNYFGVTAFKPTRALNAAVFDAIMVAVATRLSRGPIHDADAMRTKYRELLASDSFLRAALRATADEESVRTRIQLSIAAFDSVR